MLRIDLRQAQPRMNLALPVMNPQVPSRVLLKRGFELNDDIINKLNQVGIRYLWVNYPSLSFLSDSINVENEKSKIELAQQATQCFESMQQNAAAKVDYDSYVKTIKRMMENLLCHPRAAIYIGDLLQGGDDLIRHAANVSYLSTLIGMKLEGYIIKERKHIDPARAKEIINLGTGAMLHDIGLTQVDEETLAKYLETGEESDPEYREHTALGYRMLQGRLEPSAATIVLHHHQRWDGTGFTGRDYPILCERKIHIFARIASLADQIDRLRHPANAPARPMVAVLKVLMTDKWLRRFDPSVMKAMLAVLPPYPPGTQVTLSDARKAVVIDHNPDDPCRPVVQILPNPDETTENDEPPKLGPTIDLMNEAQHLVIAEHEEVDTGPLNFSLPEQMRETFLAA